MRSLPLFGLFERSKCKTGAVRFTEPAVSVPAVLPFSPPGEMIAPADVVSEPPIVPFPLSIALASIDTVDEPKVPSKARAPELMSVFPVCELFPDRVSVPVPVLVMRALPVKEPEKVELVSSPPIV